MTDDATPPPGLFDHPDEPTDAERASISDLALRVLRLQDEAADLTERLQRKLAELRQVQDVDLPQAMMAINQSQLALGDGTPVAIRTSYDAGRLTDPVGLGWLERNGGAPLIKTELRVELDREDVEKARELFRELRDHRFANRFKVLEVNQSVHPQTLGAFVRRLVEGGREPPLDALGVHRRVSAQVGARRPERVELRGIRRRR